MIQFQKPSSVDLQLYLERSTDWSHHLIMAEELKRKIFKVNILIFLFYIFYMYGSDRFWLHFLTKGGQV